MRKRLVIELEANFVNEKKIVDKISFAAMKVLRANGGNLIGIRQEEMPCPEIKGIPLIFDLD